MVTRIKASNIESGAVTTEKFAAGAVTAEKVDAGAAAGPRISSIDYPGDDTAAVPAGGQTVIINGSGFVSGCAVFLNETVVTTVGFVSATQLQITAPAKATGTYLLYVVNPDGGTAISVPGMVYSGTPTWTTASGSLGTPYETASFSVNLAATGDGSLTYAVSSGSSLPAGLTLTSGGLLSGTVPATAADTTYNFELDVIDSENQSTTRQFSITYKVDVVTWSSPAAGASFSWTEGQADSTSLAATSAAGKSISFSVQAGSLPANVTIAGNLISGTPSTTQANTAVTLRAAAADTARFADQILYFTVAASERALFASGMTSSGRSSSIDTVNISTTGNATDWGGTINNARNGLAGCSSSTRGIFSGGQMSSGFQAYIDYTSGFASTGSTSSFGSLSAYARGWHGSCSSSTRGIFGGGATPTSGIAVSNIEYITIASLGNGTTFGALTTVRRGLAACSSSTRGIFGGGSNSSGDRILSSNIQYVTIASTGNATTFGNLTVARGDFSSGSIASCSSSTRGLFAGGVNNVGSMQSVIDYVTIASTGNATNFGALTSALGWLAGASSSTRGVFAGGGITQTDYRTTIQYVTIASTGNATTFGDLTVGRQSLGACSNSHGGL